MSRRKRLSKCNKTRHHRKPESLGGSGDIRNISYVTRTKHAAWHVLFDNSSATEVAELFGLYWRDFGNESVFSRDVVEIGSSVLDDLVRIHEMKEVFTKSDIERIKKTLSLHKEKSKKRLAWLVLFKRFSSLQKIIDHINSVWIDPDFRLELSFTAKEVEKVSIQKVL